jgi:dTDP-4-amino-4,6-dideoxygalactose transaminase
MDPIMDLAQRYKLLVIEDACQAHGAEYFSARSGAWKKAGSMGQAAAFSFYPGKNLGACGEAGAVTTNNVDIAQKVRMLRDHGQAKKYYHDIEGYNGRLDAIQAGLLHIKLQYLPKWNAQRREYAVQYNQLLESVGTVSIPFEASCSRGVFHLYVIRTNNRDGLIESLKDADIGSGIHYPIPLHLQRAYRSLNYAAGDFPRAERASAQVISLPMFATLTQEQQVRVVAQIRCFLEPNAPRGFSEGMQLQTAGRSA